VCCSVSTCVVDVAVCCIGCGCMRVGSSDMACWIPQGLRVPLQDRFPIRFKRPVASADSVLQFLAVMAPRR